VTEKDRKSVFWTGSGYEMATLEKKKDLERLRLPSASLTAGYGQKRTVLISPRIVRPLPKSSVYCQRHSLTSFSASIA